MSNGSNKCLCHSGRLYEACCAPYHQGESPLNALALMRSRYSAYARGDVDYILKTQSPQSQIPIETQRKQIKAFSKQTSFLGLEILKVEEGEPYSYVTFRAILEQCGKDASFTEKSRFGRVNGGWCYLERVE